MGSMATSRSCNACIVLKEMAGDAAQNSLEEQRVCISLSTLIQLIYRNPCSSLILPEGAVSSIGRQEPR